MIKLLKILAITALSVVAALSLRITVHKVFPSLYDRIWTPRLVEKTVVQHTETKTTQQATQDKAPLPEKDLYATGVARRGRRVIVQMSDGSTRTDEDNTPKETPRLTRVTKSYADWDGKRYWFKPAPNTERSPRSGEILGAPSVKIPSKSEELQKVE